MRMISMTCGVLVTAVLGSGCLKKEVTETIYIAPSGVVWSTIERNVRSDDRAPADRAREENEYVTAVNGEYHGTAGAFRQLGAESVTTTWLRRERPYSVMTEARFAGPRELAAAILREAGLEGQVTLEHDGCVTQFALRTNLEPAPATSGDHATDELLTELRDYRFVLTEGRFVSADGFEIQDEGAIAVPDGKKTAADGVLTLALAWRAEACLGNW